MSREKEELEKFVETKINIHERLSRLEEKVQNIDDSQKSLTNWFVTIFFSALVLVLLQNILPSYL